MNKLREIVQKSVILFCNEVKKRHCTDMVLAQITDMKMQGRRMAIDSAICQTLTYDVDDSNTLPSRLYSPVLAHFPWYSLAISSLHNLSQLGIQSTNFQMGKSI
jgi:hypothetical protein